MKTVDDVIKALGGTDRATELCGVTISAIEKWRQNGRIPSKHWPNVIDEAGGKVRWGELVEMIRS